VIVIHASPPCQHYLCEAIPPAYTEYVGKMILDQIKTDGTRPLLLDLFCGAGGASMGYYRAGFDVIGVDIKPMPRYPFRFIQADALNLLDTLILGGTTNDARIDFVVDWGYRLASFAAIHASPPCQSWSIMSACMPGTREKYPQLIRPVRERLQMTGSPYVIENVGGAKSELINPVMLCGTSFGKRIWRHRLFENNFGLPPLECKHNGHPINIENVAGRKRLRDEFGVGVNMERLWITEMGVRWMRVHDAHESIPPVFTEYVGDHLMQYLDARSNVIDTVTAAYDVPKSMLGLAA
jgi:DNA (cytosine-5)-methyltransferase 1